MGNKFNTSLLAKVTGVILILFIFSSAGMASARFEKAGRLVMSFPVPAAAEGGYYIEKNVLLAVGRLNLVMESFDFDVKFTLVSFVFSTIIDGYRIDVKNYGPDFSDETKKLIERTQRGTKVYFDEIKVKGPDGKVRTINPLVLKIV
ncbi:MAG: GldM family protein [Bacteroidota bacterium]